MSLHRKSGEDDEEINLSSTLETHSLCETLLHKETHLAHFERLENIKEWIGSRKRSVLNRVDKPPMEDPLEWFEPEPDHYQVQTRHGLAILFEERAKKSPYRINPTSLYKPCIKHPSGAVYETGEKFHDFVAAENWVRQTLYELDDPSVEKYCLNNIQFTLDICKHSLPSNADRIHRENLEYLEMRIFDALL